MFTNLLLRRIPMFGDECHNNLGGGVGAKMLMQYYGLILFSTLVFYSLVLLLILYVFSSFTTIYISLMIFQVVQQHGDVQDVIHLIRLRQVRNCVMMLSSSMYFSVILPTNVCMFFVRYHTTQGNVNGVQYCKRRDTQYNIL